MKKIMWAGMVMVFFAVTTAKAQSTEAAQLLLNFEKLTQFKQILKDMQKGYTILQGGYNTIKDLSQGNFSLHKTFLDGLMAVNPAVRNYKKTAEIISYQLQLMKEYKAAFSRFRSYGSFTDDELIYMANVYDNLMKKSLDNLDDLAMVITANKLRMSDDERLQAIDRIHADMEDKLVFLRSFNGSASVLASQRAREQKDVRSMSDLQGVNK